MKDIMIAKYATNNQYCGTHRVNRYHWEIGFECYKIDRSEERAMGILVNGKAPEDTFEIVFVNYENVGVRREHFADRNEANAVVKRYLQHGFYRV